ncbi:MAG: hypothetical protein EBZ49_06290, partial [Proteobacteria bacterium]|nr:hypothetical protein [Pseudomonadota bacterium]
MSFIKNTDDFFEGLSNKFFTNERVKSAVESDLNSLSGSITGEQAARQSDVSGLDSRLDIIEGPSGQEGSIAKALVDAKSYTDQEISALVGSAPEILDTLQELSEALSGDASFAQTIAGQISSLSGAIGSESGAREAAITGLDARLDIIEGPSGQAGSIEKALADAKSYADTGLAGKVDVTVNYDIRPGIYSGGSKSANFQIDFANGPTQKFTLQSNVTVTFANPVAGGIYTLQLVQDGTGSRQITWPQITWANGSAPHLSSAGKVDFIQMWYDGTTYYGDYQLADVTFATTAALSAEASGLDARLDLLEADPTTKSYVDEAISGEQSARAADVSGLDARIDALEADPTTKAYVDGVASGLDARLDSLEADPTTKAYVDGAVSGEQSARQSADQALSGAITGEIAAREAAVSGLDSRIDALEADPTTKAYVDGVASGLDARLDSLEADPVTKAYVDGQASGLDARLDVIEGPSGQAGSIAKALVDAKAYTDQEVSALVNSAPEVLNTLKELADALSGDASFASTIAGQIGSLSGAISTEIGNRQSDVSGLDARLDALEADPTTKSYVDGQVSGLDSRIDSLEFDSVTKAYVDGAISGEQAARVADVSGLDARLDALEADPTTKAYVDGAVSGEQTRAQGVEQSLSGAITGEQAAREAAVSGLDARLDALESDPTTKAYVDGQVSGLDSRIDALEADPVTKAYVDGAISGEQSARQADVSGLDARLDALEADPTTKSYVDGAISGEQSARQADVSGLDARLDSLEADPVTKSYVDGQASGLDARLDVIEGPSGQAGSIAKALVDAKAYTD